MAQTEGPGKSQRDASAGRVGSRSLTYADRNRYNRPLESLAPVVVGTMRGLPLSCWRLHGPRV